MYRLIKALLICGFILTTIAWLSYDNSSQSAPISQAELALHKSAEPSKFKTGDRVFHMKFGNGNIVGIEGNKLTIDFDRAGQKRVLDGFVERV